ncbi:MAG: FkbM family methyltransferase [Bacteroidota bacterium]
MKTFIKYILQKLLGLKTYLYVFARFVIVKIRWDKKEKDFFHLMKLISEDGIILDLGANIGVTSYHLAKNFPNSTVYSFEPLDLNMTTLKRIKEKFGIKNIKEIQVAVGDTNGTIEMIMPVVKNVPMHGLSHVVENESSQEDSGFKYEVPLISLDNYAELNNTKEKITALKIDVENFEYSVLKGATKLLKEHNPVIYCELWDNENRTKCISLLDNLGYSAFVLNKKELVPFEASSRNKHNFFFVHN